MNRHLCYLTVVLLSVSAYLQAESPLARVVRTRHHVQPLPAAREYYDKMLEAIQKGQWNYALQYSKGVLELYPDCSFAPEATFYTGYAYLQRGELSSANEWFSKYLTHYGALKHFEEAIKLKYEIALKFASGSKKHVFNNHHLPKWEGAQEDAIQIFDEVISAFPRDQIAAQSLFNKAKLQLSLKQFDESIESYKTFIRRFPKHAMAPDAYLGIVNAYVSKSKNLFPDPDFIELAIISNEKFEREFPTDERVAKAWKEIADLKEWFAQDLITHAKYWEKKGKLMAANVYYKSILMRYQDTPSAAIAEEKIVENEKLQEQKDVLSQKAKSPHRHYH